MAFSFDIDTDIVLFQLMFSRLCEGDEEGGDKVMTELRTELWEKERKLTDIRLEALNSAHQLEQLQEAMINMQVCFCLVFLRMCRDKCVILLILSTCKQALIFGHILPSVARLSCIVLFIEDSGESEDGE